MPLLEMQQIIKDFPGVRALDGVSLALEKGEFHALVGENGAGKSTLMKVLSGAYPAGSFQGEILIENTPVRFSSVADSEAAGIAIIFQELSLVKDMTVAENIFLGQEPSRFGLIRWHELYSRTSALLRELGLEIDPQTPVGELGIGRQQLVEIAKALSKNARILVLDEPTAALTESEVEILFQILERLRRRGVGMIYISHKLEEVFRMADRITVLRDGRSVTSRPAKDFNRSKVIEYMVGRQVEDIFPDRIRQPGRVVFRASGINAYFPGSKRKAVDNVSFEVREGEVLGIAGLMGAGRSELLTTLFGAWPGRFSGEIFIDGEKFDLSSPSDAIRAKIGFVTEDRKRFGLILDQSVMDNLTLVALKKISGRHIRHVAREASTVKKPIESLRIKASTPLVAAGNLSGGNQQKVVLGKWLLSEPKVLFLDEPTRGIDVGAKQEIYAEIDRLASEGMAIVMVSSELPEVLGLSDRILVLCEGRPAATFTREQATAETVMAAATGSN